MDAYNAAAWLLDRHIATGDGDRVAARCQGQGTSYQDLQREVWRTQNVLRALGVNSGDRVVLVLNDDPVFLAWFLGAMRSGVVAVPLSTMATATELTAMVADAGASLVVVSADYRDHLQSIAVGAPAVQHAVVIGEPPRDVPISVHPWAAFTDRTEARVADTTADAQAFWLYSSGTTGTPKGVMHRHGSLQATVETYAKRVLEIGPADRCLSVAKLFFAFGLGNSLTFPLSVGACTILNPARPTPPEVANLVRSEQPSLFFASPGFVAALLDADVPSAAFSSVRYTITAGEALPASLQQRFSERFGHPVLDGIGTTEALHIFLSNTKSALRAGTSGTPVVGYDLKLLDDDDHEVTSTDTPGYLHVRGPSLATGYWQRDDATAGAFRGEWLRTGDVYTRSADGYWTFLGRNSDMIKAGGIWVSPAEVEAVLVEHPDVLEAAVVGSRDETGLEQTVAFVVLRAGHNVDDTSIERHCRARMAAFKRPRRTIVVDTLPKTATGKIQRFALRDESTTTR